MLYLLATLILYCRGRSGEELEGEGSSRGGGGGGCPDPHESVDCHSLLLYEEPKSHLKIYMHNIALWIVAKLNHSVVYTICKLLTCEATEPVYLHTTMSLQCIAKWFQDIYRSEGRSGYEKFLHAAFNLSL